MPDTFRLAIIGLGAWARRAYLPNIALMDDVELASVSTRSRRNLAAAEGLMVTQPRVFSDYRDLLDAGGIDGVVVASASPSHREIATAALMSGYPVLCEKPLALALDECDALAGASRDAGRILQVGLELRHAPVFVKAASDIAAGKIGSPALVECRVFRDKRESVTREPGKWSGSGGVFFELLCHYLDVATWLCRGQPTAVSAGGGQKLGSGVWDHGIVQVEHDNGALASLNYSLFAPPSAEQLSFSVLGDEGRMDIAFKAGQIDYVSAAADAAAETVALPHPGHPSQPYPGSYEQIRNFVAAVRGEAPPRVGADAWKVVMSVCDAAQRSMAEGARLTLDQ